MAYNKVKSSGTSDVTQTTVGAGANSGNGSGNLNGNRIGFRGTEDLGSGNKAGFVAEYGVNLSGAGTANTANDANSNTQAGENVAGAGLGVVRQGYVSLEKAGVGTLRLGTQYALHDATSGAIAGSNAVGGTNNVVGASNLLKYGYTTGAPRFANAIGYISPTFSGVTLRAMRNEGRAVTGDSTVTGTSKTNNANSLAIDYANGPVRAGLAQTKYASLGVVASTAGQTMLVDLLGGANDRVGATALSTGSLMDVKNTIAGGQYDLGVVKLGLNRQTYQTTALGTDVSKNIKSTQTMYSAAYPIQPGLTLLAGYTTGMIAQGGVDQYKTSAHDLILVKDLSKRTNVYALAVKTKYATQDATVTSASPSQSQYAVGVRHSF